MSGDLLIARVAGERIALAAVEIQSVIELGTIVPIPLVPAPVIGLATQRSRTLTVIDVALALGQPRPDKAPHHAMVLELDGVGYALAVEAVENVIPALGPLQPVKAKLSPERARCALGMVDTALGTILQVDLARLVADPQQKAA